MSTVFQISGLGRPLQISSCQSTWFHYENGTHIYVSSEKLWYFWVLIATNLIKERMRIRFSKFTWIRQILMMPLKGPTLNFNPIQYDNALMDQIAFQNLIFNRRTTFLKSKT